MSEPKKHMRLQFFLRSGNSFIIDRVTDFDVTVAAVTKKMTGFGIEQSFGPHGTKLFIQTLQPADVEAVLVLPEDGDDYVQPKKVGES